MRPVTKQTLDLIKKYEGFRANAYKCPAGVWTIGYGNTFIKGKPVQPGMTITEEEAEQLLFKTVTQFQTKVLNRLKVVVNDQQLSALVSLAYNIGIVAFERSTLLKKLNTGDYAGAAEQFSVWCKGGGKTLYGLVRRRAQEKELFLS